MKLTQDEMHELEILTLLREKDFDHNTCDNSYIDLVMKSGKKAFKIIKKQQKEIKRLYKDNFRLDRENQLKFERAVDTSDYVNKETIKNKITKLQERLKYYEELDLPQVDDNGVRTGIIKEEEILTSRARILILKELLGE